MNTFQTPPRDADQEPNDNYTTAVALSPTGTLTGHLGFYGSGATDTQDFWKITTSSNGWLRVQVRSDSLDLRGSLALDLDAALLDINGSSTIQGDGRAGTFSQVAAFLRPGTYYVRVYRWAGRAGSYEIKSEFFAPPLGNDVDGNDTYQTASTAVVNGTVTGHIGYYSDGTSDTQDFWKFAVPGNGKVVVQVTSDSLDRSGTPLDLDLATYDANGTSSMASDGRSGNFSEVTLYLRPGTFYIRVYRWSGNAGSYSLKITHTSPPRANDGEGNDAYTSATMLTYGVQNSGHIGYFADGFTDTQDYWRIVAPSSDSIYVHVTSDSTLELDLAAYGSSGTNHLASDGRLGIYSRVGINAVSGTTYYLRVYRWSGSAGSYSILASRSSVVSVETQDVPSIPLVFAVHQNYPNPFNPSTTIQFDLPGVSDVQLKIFNLMGQEIRGYDYGSLGAGFHRIVWDGRDRQGGIVPSGVYIYRLESAFGVMNRRMILVR
ncbi:MAG: T9SS type A sorting domain-containing protein [Ignavibacteria bacterium]|nr:T9SS type A sorting domain-containing protein [Ignavibacteria bacterium]